MVWIYLINQRLFCGVQATKIMSVRRNYTFVLTKNEIYCDEIGEILQTYSDRDEAERAFES